MGEEGCLTVDEYVHPSHGWFERSSASAACEGIKH